MSKRARRLRRDKPDGGWGGLCGYRSACFVLGRSSRGYLPGRRQVRVLEEGRQKSRARVGGDLPRERGIEGSACGNLSTDLLASAGVGVITVAVLR